MIFGDIKNINDMEKVLPKSIIKVINYLKESDFLSMKPGVYKIEGEDIFAQVVDITTREKAEVNPEVHKKYIDVQFSVEGKEKIGFARDTGNNEVLEDLLNEKDIKFYKSIDDEIDLIMNKGSFVVLFPNDVHRPGCLIGGHCLIRKVIVKINTEIL
ncbi:YhcH/YjgK/YiaL family protein [Clostridium estertheticum]|uniref:YhcH/YjgK/YiaL family protein n=1 Tax=Clostridium estertheticum TaxID=238834 RepID=UPI001C0D2E87|nr:YhcH/YjgK/YiaL family protein [Clostridium estertheticum]MBU3217967.1 YhcH/YjgK/YiaL family protein [Clostridium estertheticum]WAG56022.1 YhcH/YjgK/YiaL family protein [Clostridium estertheticum]